MGRVYEINNLYWNSNGFVNPMRTRKFHSRLKKIGIARHAYALSGLSTRPAHTRERISRRVINPDETIMSDRYF